MLDAALQYGDGRLQLVGLGLPALHLKAEAVRLHVLLPHLGRIGLGGGIGFLLGHSSLLPLAGGLLIVSLQLDIAGPNTFQRVQPHGDLQPPQLIPQDQILLGLLALLPERLHLKLQLRYLVVDAHQVLVRPL